MVGGSARGRTAGYPRAGLAAASSRGRALALLGLVVVVTVMGLQPVARAMAAPVPADAPRSTGAPAAALAGSPVLNRISTVAGGAIPGSGPANRFDFAIGGIALTGTTLFVHDVTNHVLRQVDLTTGWQHIIAGTGAVGSGGDGGAATSASVNDTPRGGLAADASGVYLVDRTGNRIRKVNTTTGTISTVAGTGVPGYDNGDGHPATQAPLNGPTGVAVDGGGAIFIADNQNFRVRKVDAAGVISTIAGTGANNGAGGVGFPATSVSIVPINVGVDAAGDVFIGESSNVGEVLATNHTFARPGIASFTLVDAPGGLYFSGSAACPVSGVPCVTRLAPDGTRAVVGDPAVDHGDAVALDGAGTLLFATTSVISAIGTAGTTRVVGGGPGGDGGATGPALQAALAGPVAVAVDPAGNVIVADENLVKRVTPAGTISTIAGSGNRGFSGDGGPALAADLNLSHASNPDVLRNGPDYASPGGLAFDAAGNLYLSDANNHRVRRISPDGIISTFAGGGGAAPGAAFVPATSLRLQHPTGLAVAADGSLLIADHAGSVVKVRPDGQAAVLAQVAAAAAVAVDAGGVVYVASDAVEIYGPSILVPTPPPPKWGSITAIAPGGSPAVLPFSVASPSSLAVDRAGTLFVGDAYTGLIRARTADGTVTTYGGGGQVLGEGGPALAAAMGFSLETVTSGSGGMYGKTDYYWAGGGGMAMDASGDIFLASPYFKRVRMIEHTGGLFHPISPTRVVDTRLGVGLSGPLTAGVPGALSVTGSHGVPAAAAAVVLNVTATESTDASFLTVYPAGQAPPSASNLNFATGQTVANLVTTELSAGGAVSFATAVGTTHVVVDLLGWYDLGDGPGDLFNGTSPVRLLDSRGGVGGWAGAPLGSGPGSARSLSVAGPGLAPAAATSVVMNVTVTDGTDGSFLRVWPAGGSEPNTSNVNFAAGETRANLVTIPVGDAGAVTFSNAVGATHVVVDLVGWYEPTAGNRFHPVSPRRVLDDRSGTGLSGPWSPGATRRLAVGGTNRLPADAQAVVANLTATNPTTGSFVSVYAHGGAVPVSSTLNFGPNQTIANLTVTALGFDGALDLWNQLGSVDLVLDVGGYFSAS